MSRGWMMNGGALSEQYLNAFNKWSVLRNPTCQKWYQNWAKKTWERIPLNTAFCEDIENNNNCNYYSKEVITPDQVHNFVLDRFHRRLTDPQKQILARIATFSRNAWMGFKKQLTNAINEYLKEEIQDLISEMIRETIEDSTSTGTGFKSNIQDIKRFIVRLWPLCNDINIPENTGSEYSEYDKWDSVFDLILNEAAKKETFIDELTVAKLTEKLENNKTQNTSIQTMMKEVLYKYCYLPSPTKLPMGVGTFFTVPTEEERKKIVEKMNERRRMVENTISERQRRRRRMARLQKAELRRHA